MDITLMRKRKTNEEEAEIVSEGAVDPRNTQLPYFIHTLNNKSSAFSAKYSLWIFALLTPYVIGFLLVTFLCLSLVDISLNTYSQVLVESFSLIGLWSIGYFLISIIVFIYGGYQYIIQRY